MEDFENTTPPVVLDYSRTKPLGYRATQKLTRFFPMTALPNTDIVRFIINSNGYWDPYSSYLRFTVQIKNSISGPITLTSATNAIQLDHSASSLIQTLSFIQNGVEIERIDRYELLASILNDMYFSQEQRNQRLHQGFGIGLPEHTTRTGHQTSLHSAASSAVSLPHKNFALAGSIRAHGLPQVEYASGCFIPTVDCELHDAKLDLPKVIFDGCNEPVLAGSTSDANHITKITFCVPIFSGIFGVLMPADEIKYVPMMFFPNLEMNFRLNPYAFFSNHPASAFGRNFEVTNCELFVNMIYFAPAINTALVDMVKERGLYMHTCSYYYGPSHVIPATSSMETYPINMSFKSLRSLLWAFIPSNYRIYPYIRELRRKALNLTSAQVRVGGDLYPTFPIGNLGTSSSSSRPQTNSDFLVNLYKAFGRLHDTVNDSLINSHNFCAGNTLVRADYITNYYTAGTSFDFPSLVRGYEVEKCAADNAFYDKATAGAPLSSNQMSWDNSINGNFLINQIVPRAAYGIDLDTITSDDSVISGVNTLINKPFELLLEGRNDSAESCELNMFLYYDFVVMIDRDFTVKYLGRGG